MKWKTLATAAFLIVMSAIPVASQTLTVSVTGSGKVTGAGINCPSDCSQPLAKNTSVRATGPYTVVLTGAAGVVGHLGPVWGGACKGTTGPTCTFTVPLGSGGAFVSAEFFAPFSVPDFPDLNPLPPVRTAGPGKMSPGPLPANPVSWPPFGTVLTYRAEPNAGASFAGWSGVCTGRNPVCTHTLSGPFTLVASFGWPVTVTIEGAPGGRVTGKGIDCPTVCTGVAVPPTLTLAAIGGREDAGVFAFHEWGGDCKTVGSTTWGATCTFHIDGPKSVSVQFVKRSP